MACTYWVSSNTLLVMLMVTLKCTAYWIVEEERGVVLGANVVAGCWVVVGERLVVLGAVLLPCTVD